MKLNFTKMIYPDDLKLGNVIAVDGEFMGLNVRRDPLCLIQISTGKSDAILSNLTDQITRHQI